MKHTRRGLFGLAAGAAAAPFVPKPTPLGGAQGIFISDLHVGVPKTLPWRYTQGPITSIKITGSRK